MASCSKKSSEPTYRVEDNGLGGFIVGDNGNFSVFSEMADFTKLAKVAVMNQRSVETYQYFLDIWIIDKRSELKIA